MEEWEEPLHPGSLRRTYPTSSHNATLFAHSLPQAHHDDPHRGRNPRPAGANGAAGGARRRTGAGASRAAAVRSARARCSWGLAPGAPRHIRSLRLEKGKVAPRAGRHRRAARVRPGRLRLVLASRRHRSRSGERGTGSRARVPRRDRAADGRAGERSAGGRPRAHRLAGSLSAARRRPAHTRLSPARLHARHRAVAGPARGPVRALGRLRRGPDHPAHEQPHRLGPDRAAPLLRARAGRRARDGHARHGRGALLPRRPGEARGRPREQLPRRLLRSLARRRRIRARRPLRGPRQRGRPARRDRGDPGRTGAVGGPGLLEAVRLGARGSDRAPLREPRRGAVRRRHREGAARSARRRARDLRLADGGLRVAAPRHRHAPGRDRSAPGTPLGGPAGRRSALAAPGRIVARDRHRARRLDACRHHRGAVGAVLAGGQGRRRRAQHRRADRRAERPVEGPRGRNRRRTARLPLVDGCRRDLRGGLERARTEGRRLDLLDRRRRVPRRRREAGRSAPAQRRRGRDRPPAGHGSGRLGARCPASRWSSSSQPDPRRPARSSCSRSAKSRWPLRCPRPAR